MLKKLLQVKTENLCVCLIQTADIIVTVSKDVYEDYQNIKEGDRIMAWYSIMTMSLPGQTNATKVIVLP